MAARQGRNSSHRKPAAPESPSTHQLRGESRSRNGAVEEGDAQSPKIEGNFKKAWRNVTSSLTGSSPPDVPKARQHSSSSESPDNHLPRVYDTRGYQPPQLTATPSGDDLHDSQTVRRRSQSMAPAIDSNSETAGQGYAHTNQESALIGPSGQQPISGADKNLPPDPANAGAEEINDTDASLKDQLLAATKEIETLTALKVRLQKQKTHAAASRIEADPLAPFRVAEDVIRQDFKTFSYNVHNFVRNYYKDPSKQDFKAWAKENHLANIYPDFSKVAGEKGTPTYLVEAAIWELLMSTVFTRLEEGRGVLWAGGHARKVSRLGKSLASSIGDNDLERLRAFHQWRALTTCLATAVDWRHTGRDGAEGITEDIEDLLEPLRLSTRARKGMIGCLRALANEAVELDQKISSQQTCYRLNYPAQPFNGKADSTEVVVVTAAGQAAAEKKGAVSYSFVITPLLHRSGGPRGEGYGSSEGFILEPAKAYCVDSRVWSRG